MFYIPYCQAVEIIKKNIEFVLWYTARILIFFTENLHFLKKNLNNELKHGHENEVQAGDGKLKINFVRPNVVIISIFSHLFWSNSETYFTLI